MLLIFCGFFKKDLKTFEKTVRKIWKENGAGIKCLVKLKENLNENFRKVPKENGRKITKLEKKIEENMIKIEII